MIGAKEVLARKRTWFRIFFGTNIASLCDLQRGLSKSDCILVESISVASELPVCYFFLCAKPWVVAAHLHQGVDLRGWVVARVHSGLDSRYLFNLELCFGIWRNGIGGEGTHGFRKFVTSFRHYSLVVPRKKFFFF